MYYVIALLLSLAVIVVLAMRSVHVFLFATIGTLALIVLSRMPLLETLTGPYMSGFASYMSKNWLIFFTSAMFAKVLGDSGAAKVIAHSLVRLSKKFKHEELAAILFLNFTVTLMVLGGISGFVVNYLIVTIALNVFREYDIPWHIQTAGCWASGTFAMALFPGTPTPQNLVPTSYLGTTPTAAPVLGIIGTIILIPCGIGYVAWCLNHYKYKKGERFLPTGAVILEREVGRVGAASQVKVAAPGGSGEEGRTQSDMPPYGLLYCLIPSIVLFVVMNGFKLAPVFAIMIALVLSVVMFWKTLPNPFKSCAEGANNALNIIGGVCAITGFGAVVAASPAYPILMSALEAVPGSIYFQIIIASNIGSAMCGSASGGLGIVMENLSERWLATGLNPQVIHRLACIGAIGIDSLPHNGSVTSSLRLQGVTHKEAYKHYFWQNTVFTVITGFILAAIASLGIV